MFAIPGLLAVILIGASPNSDADELMRQGNAAFERKDYLAAVAIYVRAEPIAADPGHVAFNKAAALYHLGKYREAERHYRCAVENASEPRRTKARYCLANCLVRQGQEMGAKALQEAIELYEMCLRSESLDPEFATDARHNLELAKLLWLEAMARATERPEDVDVGEQTNPHPHDQTGARQQPRGDEDAASSDSKGSRVPGKPDAATKPKPADEPPAPGTGTLPPVPDAVELPPLTPGDAAAHLEEAAARIVRERNAHRVQSAKPVSPGVKDW